MDKRREDLAFGASLLFMCETHRWRSVKNERLPAQLSKKRGCSTTGSLMASLKHGASARFQLQKQVYERIVRK